MQSKFLLHKELSEKAELKVLEGVKNKIIQMVGDLPRIELFARKKTEGWDVWGQEV